MNRNDESIKSVLRKNSLYVLLILVVAAAGVGLDFWANNYDLVFDQITIPLANNKTDQKLIVTVPAAAQIMRLIANFSYALAMTIFVSVFIVESIERKNKRDDELRLQKLSDAVNINVFDALFKTLIPHEIFKIVKAEIIESKAIRRKAHWIFVFEEKEEKVLMNATTFYELHNVSGETLFEPVKIDIDQMSSSLEKVVRAKCIDSGGKILVEYDDEKDIKNNITLEYPVAGKSIIKFTASVAPGDFITSTLERVTAYGGDVFDAQNTRYPMIDLEIQAVYPKGYKFTIYPLLSSELRTISEGATQSVYRVEGGILPGQGILYTLKKIS